MVKINERPLISPLPKPVEVASTPSPAGPVPMPYPNIAVDPSGFDAVKKKLVSITGRHPSQKMPAQTGDGVRGQMLEIKGGVEAGTHTKKVKLDGPKDVGTFLAKAMKVPVDHDSLDPGDVKVTKKALGEAVTAINAHDYKKAAAKIEEAIRKGGDVLDQTDGTGGAGERSAQTIQSQLEFLGKLQDKGIKADYPPTETQLVEFFGKLKPEEARAALGEYFKAFHKHPAGTGADPDVKYSDDGTLRGKGSATPDSWKEVLNRPTATQDGVSPDYTTIGKQLNDCEGFAFMAEKLMKAAGFQVLDHLTVKGATKELGNHAMVAFKHPDESQITLTSNDEVFKGKNELALAKQGYKYAAGEDYTGSEKMYQGTSMQDSQVNAQNKKKVLTKKDH